MEFGFKEPQRSYDSGTQKARVWTEQWVADWLFCPNCGNKSIFQLPANLPVADFYCAECGDQYELKSQKKPFGTKVVDGAYKTMCERLESHNNPNFLLLQYDLPTTSVVNVCVIPKHFFVPEIIEQRKPLPPTARRAGWVGCNILMDRIPESGRVYVVRNRVAAPKDIVVSQWRQTLFLREERPEARGWLIEVMHCIDALGAKEFSIQDMYKFDDHLRKIYPGNNNIKPKIRQQLQILRYRGYLDFADNARYHRNPNI